MIKPASFPDLLAHFSTLDLRDALGVPYVTARKMRERGAVGVDHWPALIEAAKAKGIEITEVELLAMRPTRRVAA